MSAPAFDPIEIMDEVFARANASPPATIATLRHNEPNCRNVATVATPPVSTLPRDCRNVAIVATIDGPEIEINARQDETAGLFTDRVSETECRQALDDGGHFLDTWGWVTESEWAWTACELFNIPSPGKPGGLIWRLRGRSVISYGPDYVRLDDETIIERC
ncbi:hypothetical protein QM467_18270 [Rhodoblastus sp. 17X3]|uniref:hypothetical protein n=1 Tax=Rhodoblastus sp. 17X3 TaxID=3047026 RepID=UPI0024B7E875|nr:hypothetical protein [Rhodoblastus sp. 17X3]MDI9849988.1 hypothetical protein [Rhodoblastus sp. 17X3]